MKAIKTLIISLLFSVVINAQGTSAKDTTMISDTVPLISLRDFTIYMERLNAAIQKQFDLSDESVVKYQKILSEMRAILNNATEKGKRKKQK